MDEVRAWKVVGKFVGEKRRGEAEVTANQHLYHF